MERYFIKFHGPNDLDTFLSLKDREIFLDNFNEDDNYSDINKILDLYNINRSIITHKIQLNHWSDEQYTRYVSICNRFMKIVGNFSSTISNENIKNIHATLAFPENDFWELVCHFEVYKRIKWETIKSIIEGTKTALERILCQKKIVQHFDSDLAIYMRSSDCMTPLIINKYLISNHTFQKDELFLPERLTSEDLKALLSRYIDSPEADAALLWILSQGSRESKLKIDDRLRLRAKKNSQKLFSQSIKSNNSKEERISVAIIDNLKTDKKYIATKKEITILYDRNWIQDNLDYPTILNNFIYVFDYADIFGRWNLISEKYKPCFFENYLFIRGKSDYPMSLVFDKKCKISTLSMGCYFQELLSHKIDLETIFEWFFSTYLKEEFGVVGFSYQAPTPKISFQEKCKLIAIKIDDLLKQYQLFSENGTVERELFELSSSHICFSNLKSLQQQKYAYASKKKNNGGLPREHLNLTNRYPSQFFSKKLKNKMMSIIDAVEFGNTHFHDFSEQIHPNLNFLINCGSLLQESNGSFLLNKNRIHVINELAKNIVIPINYFKNWNNLLDSMHQNGDIEYGNTLFSIPEQNYLNFMLNKSSFLNGPDLRNKYLHGTNSNDPRQNEFDYYEFLKIMSLIVIKINEEFCLRHDLNKLPDVSL